MGATAEKLTYLNTTKSKIRTGLNDLGAGLTDNDTFRSYANVLADIYDELPKVTGEATDLELSNTKKGKLAITPKGSSSQFSTTGKNLLQNSASTQTISGVTFTVNDDKTISTSGTSSAQISLQINKFRLNADSYKLNGCPAGGSDSKYEIQAYGGLSGTARDRGEGASFTATGESDTTVNLVIRSGVNCNGLVFKPMIRLATVTDGSFEPYTGGIAAPNPDYPFQVKSVTGENGIIISEQNLPSEYTRVDYLKSDGTQYINTGIQGKSGIRAVSDFELLEIPSANTPICGSYNLSNSQRFYLGIIQSNGKIGMSYITTAWSNTILTTNTKYNMDINFALGNQSLKINNETVLTGTSTTTITQNKNTLLFGYDKGDGFDYRYPIKLKVYNYKFYDNNTLIRNYVPCYRNSDGKTGMYDIVNNVFYPAQGTSEFEYGYVADYQLSLGNIELNSSPDGTIRDQIVGSPNNWFKREYIGKFVLDGTESGWTLRGTDTNTYRFTNDTVISDALAKNNTSLYFCNEFQIYAGNSGIANIDDNGIALRDSLNGFTIRILKTLVTGLDNFKTWLSSNNATGYYLLATPVDVPITDTTLINQLNDMYDNAHSYKGTTNITSTYASGNEQMVIDASALKSWNDSNE